MRYLIIGLGIYGTNLAKTSQTWGMRSLEPTAVPLRSMP